VRPRLAPIILRSALQDLAPTDTVDTKIPRSSPEMWLMEEGRSVADGALVIGLAYFSHGLQSRSFQGALRARLRW
jgi:hypothetical protein